MSNETVGGWGNYDGQTFTDDVKFLTQYVQKAGDQAWVMREQAAVETKPDGTWLTTADEYNRRLLARDGRRAYGPTVAIHSEEGDSVRPSDHALVLVADELDGTGEYGATHHDPITGKLVRLGRGEAVPLGMVPIEDGKRTSCVAAGIFRDGVMHSAAVYGLYSDKLFVADRDLGATYLNGRRLDLSRGPESEQAFEPGIPYDFASWRGSLLDPRHLRRRLGRAPNGVYSAVMQGCDVLTADSMTSVFTGDTRHDLIPGLMVELAGGVFTDLNGNPIDWDNPHGGVYSVNADLHAGTIAALNAPRIDGLPPGYTPVGKDETSGEEVLGLRTAAAFGTEERLNVWQDALDSAYAFVGAREIKTGRLVLVSFLTGSSRHGTMHDLVVHPEHTRQGLASYAVDKRVELARRYEARGERVGMAYLEVDLGMAVLQTVAPLQDCFDSHGFELNRGTLIRDFRHNDTTIA